MVGPQFSQLDVSYLWVNPACQLLVSHNGGVLDPGFLFQVNHIIAVRAELLAAVSFDPLPALLLEDRGESLGPFFCAFFRPGGGHVKSSRPGFELSSISSPATVDANGVGDQLTVFIPSLLNVCHLAALRLKVLSILVPYPVPGAVVTILF